MKNKPVFFRRYGVSLALAVVGGFLEAYTYVTRDGVFANAQTGNVVLMGQNFLLGNWDQGIDYMFPVISWGSVVIPSRRAAR